MDDTYYFIEDLNENYISSNLSDETFINNRFHFMIYLDQFGDIKFHKNFGADTPIDQRKYDELLTVILFSDFFKELKGIESTHGILPLSMGQVLFAAQPIAMSQGQGEPRGTLIIGRLLNQEEVERIATATNLDIEIKYLGQRETAEFTEDPQYLSSIPTIIQVNQDLITGKALLEDAYGQDTVEITIRMPRDVFHEGVKSVNSLIISIVLTGIVITLTTIFLLEKVILSRLMALAANVSNIRKSKDLSSRVPITGEDEISHLEEEFNKMMSSLEKSQQKMKHSAYHDALTGLPNRLLFYERLNQLIANAEQEGKLLAVIFIDLDKFKEINDSLGHDYGDALLRKVAEGLRNSVREGDVISRIGGDEFTVILSHIESNGEVEVISQRILAELVTPYQIKGESLMVSASLGISFYPTDCEDAEGLLKKADQAMYASKNKGGNQYYFYRPGINQMNKYDTINLKNNVD
ncbi:sensor domain-containing diguanylate cyclase [Caldalkalibacillus mannanilyticus]|uniref:sensor domain-containing diguanylate cyclase n=1 Tax=Caldalkalibacillus mannanilyticus TaxID=1418 RepID=UPI000469D5C1|nr:diguanylate cyclase [Caldalkalibacillus mannanilyticus]